MKLRTGIPALAVPGVGDIAIPERGFNIGFGDGKLKSRLKATLVGFSNAYEKSVLEHVTGRTTLTLVTPVYLALCTSAVDDTKTGSTITEAGYTGYARASIANTAWAAATGNSPSSVATNTTITFANCTAGTSTIQWWALCTALTVGNVIMWGTCTSTVISTTQTPATVASGALSLTLD